MANRSRLLKLDSDGAGTIEFREMSSADILRVSNVSGRSFALNHDSNDAGNISIIHTSRTLQVDSIGEIEDNYYNEATGTDIDLITLVTETTFVRMQNATHGSPTSAQPKDHPLVGNRQPLLVEEDVSYTVTNLQEASFENNSITNALLDDIIVNIFENGLCGTYSWQDSAQNVAAGVYNATDGIHYPDSDLWQKKLVHLDNNAGNGAGTDYPLYQKIGLTPGSSAFKLVEEKVSPIFPEVTGGSLDNLKAFSDSDFGAFFAQQICNRLAYNQLNDGVGKLLLRETSPGVDYKQLGQGIRDLRRSLDGSNSSIIEVAYTGAYTGTYAGDYVGTYAGSRVTTANYGRTVNFYRNQNYSNFSRVVNYSGNRTFAGNYDGSYAGTRDYEYSGTYSGLTDVSFTALNSTTTVVNDYRTLYVKVS